MLLIATWIDFAQFVWSIRVFAAVNLGGPIGEDEWDGTHELRNRPHSFIALSSTDQNVCLIDAGHSTPPGGRSPVMESGHVGGIDRVLRTGDHYFFFNFNSSTFTVHLQFFTTTKYSLLVCLGLISPLDIRPCTSSAPCPMPPLGSTSCSSLN